MFGLAENDTSLIQTSMPSWKFTLYACKQLLGLPSLWRDIFQGIFFSLWHFVLALSTFSNILRKISIGYIFAKRQAAECHHISPLYIWSETFCQKCESDWLISKNEDYLLQGYWYDVWNREVLSTDDEAREETFVHELHYQKEKPFK